MSSLRRWAGLVALLVVPAVLVLAAGPAPAQKEEKKEKKQKKDKTKDKKKEVWTDANDPTLPVDFKFQGEYAGAIKDGEKLGAQVIALGGGRFQAVVYPGGLPGDGWDGKNKILMDGKLEDSRVAFTPTKGKRRYKVQKPEEFSATSKFPPVGQKDYIGASNGEALAGKTEDGKPFSLKKTLRKSPTLGAKPPQGALVLFDGSNTDEWTGGRLDKKNGILNTDGHDIKTKKKFNNYTAHVELMIPFRPNARDQGRGNSGFYQADRYEVQILDSFGLDGKNNECGGIYGLVEPKLNMCYPPLTWQTYDVDFTNAVVQDGKKVSNPRITVKFNGVVIHDDVQIKRNTEDPNNKNEGTPGALRLQGHGNPVQFRNIWIVEKK
jgi:hypothetical protein